jgi:hypothetical protein
MQEKTCEGTAQYRSLHAWLGVQTKEYTSVIPLAVKIAHQSEEWVAIPLAIMYSPAQQNSPQQAPSEVLQLIAAMSVLSCL